MYLHLSFNDSLDGVWKPRLPAGSELNSDGKYPEPRTPRISVSTTLAGCFYAIYPNISQFFEKRHYPHIDINVYVPEMHRDIRVVTNHELKEKRYVHDAHITHEVWILDAVVMKRIGKVRFKNTSDDKWLNYHPFGDPKEPLRRLAPKVDYEILKGKEHGLESFGIALPPSASW